MLNYVQRLRSQVLTYKGLQGIFYSFVTVWCQSKVVYDDLTEALANWRSGASRTIILDIEPLYLNNMLDTLFLEPFKDGNHVLNTSETKFGRLESAYPKGPRHTFRLRSGVRVATTTSSSSLSSSSRISTCGSATYCSALSNRRWPNVFSNSVLLSFFGWPKSNHNSLSRFKCQSHPALRRQRTKKGGHPTHLARRGSAESLKHHADPQYASRKA